MGFEQGVSIQVVALDCVLRVLIVSPAQFQLMLPRGIGMQALPLVQPPAGAGVQSRYMVAEKERAASPHLLHSPRLGASTARALAHRKPELPARGAPHGGVARQGIPERGTPDAPS